MLKEVGRCKRIVAANAPIFTILLVADRFVVYIEGLRESSAFGRAIADGSTNA